MHVVCQPKKKEISNFQIRFCVRCLSNLIHLNKVDPLYVMANVIVDARHTDDAWVGINCLKKSMSIY